MEEYVIKPTNGRPAFRFNGELLAAVDSKRHNSRMWTELEAYKTQAGRWVIVEIGHVNENDNPHGYQTRRDVFVFDDTSELTSKIGCGRLAERLYKRLGFDEITIG